MIINEEIRFELINQDNCDILVGNTDEKMYEFLGMPIFKESSRGVHVVNHWLAHSNHVNYFIIINNNYVGIIYKYDDKPRYKKCSLGIGIFKQYRSKGYSRIVVDKFVEYLFNSEGYIRVAIDVETTNNVSLKLTDTWDFEGVARSYWGHGVDVKIFSRINAIT